MSAVRAANTVSPEPYALAADVQAMQDVLYDILATGLDADQTDVPSEEIERFLHEHARSPKSLPDFCGFFAKHGLSLRARPPYEPVALALPPIERPEPAHATVMSPAPEPNAVEFYAAEPDTGAHRIAGRDAIAPMPRARAAIIGLWAAAAALAAVLGVVIWYGCATIAELRGDLARTSRQDQQNRAAIRALREHATSLESSVAATSQLMQRVDQKSDLLIETLLTQSRANDHKRH